MKWSHVLMVAACVVLATLAGCWSPPQIGPNRESFKAVDALYTAISLRDPALVDRCRQRLEQLQGTGKLPDPAFQTLIVMIDETKSGRWEPSQEQLASFMEGQRRERARPAGAGD